jgi:regulator of PEP synthase PpsR (kinase-PPPase family)
MKYHVHLVSDSTGETLKSMSSATLSQFPDSEADCIEHLWALVRTTGQMERVIQAIAAARGIVLFTLVAAEMRDMLQEGCRNLGVPCIPVLDPVLAALGAYLGEQAQGLPGKQHQLDAHYFARIEAMQFTMAHDDGQATEDVDKADVVLVGVSRTSKTPTSIYLANRGLRTANIPLIAGLTLPPELETATRPLIVGLTTSPDRLIQVRRNRLESMKVERNTAYVDIDAVKDELAHARRIFTKFGWPVIDVTRRSIEETAASIFNLYQRRAEQQRAESGAA